MRGGLKTRLQAFRISAPGRGKASPSLRSPMDPDQNPFACLYPIVEEENKREGFAELPFANESAFRIMCLVKTKSPRLPWELRMCALVRYGLYLMSDTVDIMISKTVEVKDCED